MEIGLHIVLHTILSVPTSHISFSDLHNGMMIIRHHTL